MIDQGVVVLVAFGVFEVLGDLGCASGRLLGTDMLCYAFMRRAFLVGLCIGVIGPLIGTFLVHRRLALIGDSLAHTAFAGVAIGLFLASVTGWTGSPLLAATVVTVIAALLIQYLTEAGGEYGDVAMAIILTGAFALGTVLISISGGISVSIASYLFGSIVTVTERSVTLLGGLTAVVVAVVALSYKQLLFVTFDEEAARVARLKVSLYNRVLVVLTALVVVGAVQILGVILVAGLLVIPVATGANVASSFRSSLLLAVVAGELAVVVGLVLSYHWDLATGGTIILVSVGGYGATALWEAITAGRSLL
jgi:zinc transport system permease protein